MATAQRSRITTANTVHLCGRNLPVQGRVLRSLASRFPPKVATGDVGVEQNPVISTKTWRDVTGGVGVETEEPKEETNSVWYSNLSLRHRAHLVLPALTTQTASAEAVEIGRIGEFNNSIYASHDDAVYEYSNSTDAWTSSRDIEDAATDSLTLMLSEKETLCFATGVNVHYLIDTGWKKDTDNIKFLAEWRDLLWGLDTDGKLYFTSSLGDGSGNFTQTNAKVPLPPELITGLLRGPAPSGDADDALYCATQEGLLIYDNENERFVPTRLYKPSIPPHPDNGKGTTTWRESIYFPSGHGLFRFTPAGVTQISVVGLDQRDGLRSNRRGTIVTMAASANDLLVGLDASSGGTEEQDINLFHSQGFGRSFFSGQRWNQIGRAKQGIPPVVGWNGRSWEVKWDGGTIGKGIDHMLVANAFTRHRLWWAHNKRVYYMPLPVDIINPTQLTSQDYGSSGFVDYPWFGREDIPKTAYALRLQTRNCDDSHTALLQYALDFDENDSAFVTVATQKKDGEITYPLPLAEDQKGVPFSVIRPRITLSRLGTTPTASPDVVKLSLDYGKVMNDLWQFDFTVDLTDERTGYTPTSMGKFIRGLIAAKENCDFTFRDDPTNEENYWVRVVGYREIANTGSTSKAQAVVSVVQVVS